MMRFKTLADAALGSRVFTAAPRRATRRGLRVLAYHGVEDTHSFAAQIVHVTERYTPTTADRIVAALTGADDLPPGAVWITFDDGDPSVVENALPVLHDAGIRATMFVCPGVADTETPLWWQAVEQALATGVELRHQGITFDRSSQDGLVRRLKTVPDEERRAIVADLVDRARVATGSPQSRRQLTTEMLQTFVAAGGTVGNHTWDHPCLDMASPAEQQNQIVEAHHWLAERLPEPPRLFSYPNGNHTLRSEAILEELGYSVATLFDHRIGSTRANPLRLSRLRVNDTTSISRFSSILAGLHPAVHAVRTRASGK